MSKADRCMKCGTRKATKVGKPNLRGEDKLQRMRCDNCSQMRMKLIKPRKAKENKDGSDSHN